MNECCTAGGRGAGSIVRDESRTTLTSAGDAVEPVVGIVAWLGAGVRGDHDVFEPHPPLAGHVDPRLNAKRVPRLKWDVVALDDVRVFVFLETDAVAGAVHDVALDLRPESATYKQSFATELSATNGRALFMPEGIAHGFQTLADDSTLFYQMSTAYEAEAATGVRWNDPAFQIDWPLADPIVNDRDQSFPDYAS